MSDKNRHSDESSSSWHWYYLLALIPCICIGFLAVIHLKWAGNDLRIIQGMAHNARLIEHACELNFALQAERDLSLIRSTCSEHPELVTRLNDARLQTDQALDAYFDVLGQEQPYRQEADHAAALTQRLSTLREQIIVSQTGCRPFDWENAFDDYAQLIADIQQISNAAATSKSDHGIGIHFAQLILCENARESMAQIRALICAKTTNGEPVTNYHRDYIHDLQVKIDGFVYSPISSLDSETPESYVYRTMQWRRFMREIVFTLADRQKVRPDTGWALERYDAVSGMINLLHDQQHEQIGHLEQHLSEMHGKNRLQLFQAISWAMIGLVGMGVIVCVVIGSERAHRRTVDAKIKAEVLVDEVRHAEVRLNLAMKSSNQGLWELNLIDGSTYYNDIWCAMLGYKPDELTMHTSTWESLCHPGDLAEAKRELKQYLQGNIEHYRSELRLRMKNGLWKWVLDTGEIIERDESGNPTRMIGVQIDIDHLKTNELKLAESETRYKLAVKGSRDGLWDWDLITDRVYYAPQWKKMLGLNDEDQISDRPEEWISRIEPGDAEVFMQKLNEHLCNDGGVFEVEMRMIHTSGKPVWMLCRGTVIHDTDGQAIRVAGSLADITEIKNAQEQLKHLAEHDRLTGLPNRELFLRQVQESINRNHSDPDYHFAVLFFDFDRFKLINDSLGHNIGDALLKDIAELFRKKIRPTDVASRFGGDEFVLLLRNFEEDEQAEQIATRLLDTFSQPHNLSGHEVYSTASIGLVKGGAHYTQAEEVVRDADAAMYQAKEAGRDRYVLFDQMMHENNLERVKLERDLHDAIDKGQIWLAYQPIVDLETGEVHGFEALARWDHPEHGSVPPEKFIHIAEDTGLIVPIGEHVLRTACQQAVAWRNTIGDRKQIYVNVNLSLRQLAHPNAIDMIRQTIYDTGIQPHELKLEITESTIIDKRYNMIPRLQAIRELGIHLAMDDFGTGHSSLSNLHQLPVDILKIDQGFVKSLSANRELAAVMQTIIMLARNLDMTTIAEGIEDVDQLVVLQALGCELAQGYYFNPPMPVDQATDYLLGLDEQHATA